VVRTVGRLKTFPIFASAIALLRKLGRRIVMHQLYDSRLVVDEDECRVSAENRDSV